MGKAVTRRDFLQAIGVTGPQAYVQVEPLTVKLAGGGLLPL